MRRYTAPCGRVQRTKQNSLLLKTSRVHTTHIVGDDVFDNSVRVRCEGSVLAWRAQYLAILFQGEANCFHLLADFTQADALLRRGVLRRCQNVPHPPPVDGRQQ